MGNVLSDKVFHILIDWVSSKTLFLKYVVTLNYQPIHSNDDLQPFPLAGAKTSDNLVALTKICFPEFNHDIAIDEHTVFILDSNILWYKIIFGADFLDKRGFHLDYGETLSAGLSMM